MKSSANMAASGQDRSGASQPVAAAGSPVLAAGQRIIEGIKLTTGVGDPDTGTRFGVGAQGFAAALQTLTAAFPGNGWDGTGSTTYTGRNEKLVDDSQAMAEADQLVASVLNREAEQISAIRDGLDRQSDWLGSMSVVTGAVGSLTPAGHAAQARAEMEMVARAVGESTSQLMTMHDNAGANAAAVRDAVSLYAGITAERDDDGVDEPDAPIGDATDEPEESGEPADVNAAQSGEASAGAAGPLTAPPEGAIAQSSPTAPVAPTPSAQTPAAPPVAPGGEVAGALAGLIGPIIGTIAGIIGGIAQAAGQAAQIATQTAGQAAQAASQPDESAVAGAGSVNGTDSADEPEELENGKDDESGEDDRGATVEPSSENELADAPPGMGRDNDSAGKGNDSPAKTLPPDLGPASLGRPGQEPRTMFISTDLEHGQLRRPVPATLERGIPGSAAVLTQAEVLE